MSVKIVYENDLYMVKTGVAQESDRPFLTYQVINKDTSVVEHEASMLAECMEAADFFKEKLDLRSKESEAKVNKSKMAVVPVH